MRKLFFFLFLLTTNTHASFFDKKLQVYECARNVCDSTCKKVNGLFFEFKINKEKNFVLLNAFRDGNIQGNNALKNCSIIDSKNWSCEDNSEISLNRHSMTNQVYVGMSLLTIGNKTTQTSICAK
jgi:hypothetical protein